MTRRVPRPHSILLMLFVLSGVPVLCEQDKSATYQDELRNGDTYMQRRMYEQALRTYKHAHALADKRSYEAVVGIALAYADWRRANPSPHQIGSPSHASLLGITASYRF
jgi:hypothetical protein